MAEEKLKRQPDPEPPVIVDTGAPSVLLYIGLLVLAGLLVAVTFIGEAPDWPGLLVNLSTEIIGAVIILIIVERRLRQSEVRAIRSYTDPAAARMYSVFSRDISRRMTYARNLGQQLQLIRPGYYVERTAYKNLLDKYPKGFLLIGEPGSGKTVILQNIAKTQITEVLNHPRKEALPLFFAAHHWSGGDLLDWMFMETGQYTKLKRKDFDRWFASGRLALIFDGVDEVIHSALFVDEIARIQNAYPITAIILSCRTLHYASIKDSFAKLELPEVETVGFTDEEMERLLRNLSAELPGVANTFRAQLHTQ